MAASIALGCGGKGLLCGPRARRSRHRFVPGRLFIITAQIGHRQPSRITSSRQLGWGVRFGKSRLRWTPRTSPFEPEPTKPVSPTILDADQQAPPYLERLGGRLSVRQVRWGEKQNAEKLFPNYFSGFGVRRGNCFVSIGSGPPRSAGASGGNLGFDDPSAHLRLRSATSRRRSISPSHHEPRHFWRPTAA